MRSPGEGHGVLELNVGLPRMRRKEGSAALEAGELVSAGASDREVRQDSRELGDVEAHDAERRRGVVTEVRLRGERIGSAVSNAEFVEQSRGEEMGFIHRQALCDQRGVLNAGHIGSEIELRSCRRGRREAAGSLAAGQRVRRGLDEPLVAEPAKERILAAGVVVDPYIATVVIDDLVGRRGVVVEAAGGLWQRGDIVYV